MFEIFENHVTFLIKIATDVVTEAKLLRRLMSQNKQLILSFLCTFFWKLFRFENISNLTHKVLYNNLTKFSC